MTRHGVPTPRDLLRTIVLRTTAMVVGFLVVLAVAAVALPASATSAADAGPAQRVDARSLRADAVAELVRTHGCWSGHAPAGSGVPGHAVVSLPGEQPRLVPSQVGFEIWLDGRPGTLHAFCR